LEYIILNNQKFKSSLIALMLGLCLAGRIPAEELPAPLTPASLPTPRINGPGVFGVRPGSAFLYTMPATGDRPLTFLASPEFAQVSGRQR
jgi:hypothetical protein